MTELKRRTLLGRLASLPIFGRCADAGPPSFELIPALQAGRQWRFAFERKVTRGDAVMDWYRAPLQVRVLDAGADGALLPAIARFAIRTMQPRARRADLGRLMISDPVAMTAAAQAGVDTAARIANDAVDGDIVPPALAPVSLEERGDFAVDTATAWPVRATHARTVRVGALAQVDSTAFNLA